MRAEERWLTWKRNAKDEDGDGNDEDNSRYPTHGADVVSIDCYVTGATIRFRLYFLLGDLAGDLLLSVSRGSLVLVLLWRILPVREREVEAGHIAARRVELVKGTLFRDLAVFAENDDVIRIR